MVVRYNTDGTLTTSTTQYVYSPRYVDAVICRDVSDGATLQDGSRIYYLSDANHNVTAVLDAGWSATRPTPAPDGRRIAVVDVLVA
jgi:hypothetical protein